MWGVDFANAFIYVHVFVSCACSGLRVTYHPSDCKWIWCCKFINSLASLFSFNDSLQCNNQPIQSPRLWGNEIRASVCFLLVISNAAREFLENVNSKVQFVSKVWKAMQTSPSCFSHHVECTKTWLGDVSSVCGSQSKSAKPHSSCCIRLKWVRAVVTDDWAGCDTHTQNLS